MSTEMNFVLFPKFDTGSGATKKQQKTTTIIASYDECHAALLSSTVWIVMRSEKGPVPMLLTPATWKV